MKIVGNYADLEPTILFTFYLVQSGFILKTKNMKENDKR